MADGRTFWYSEDAAYVDRERVVALGEEFGMAVLAVMFVLRGQAKLQNDGGWVVSGVSTLARKGFIDDRELARRIIERAAEVGELDDLQWLDEMRFRCRLSGWAADQERGATAKRVADHRARNGVKRSVTGGNENRTGQDRDNDDSLRSSSVESAEQISELFAFWQQQCGHSHAKLSPGRRRKIASRLREGFTPQQIREAISGAAIGAFVGENGKRFDDIELICRSAEKLESFIGREAPTASPPGRESPSDLLRAMEVA